MVEPYEEFKRNYSQTHPLAAVFNKNDTMSDFQMHHEYYIQVLYNGTAVDMLEYKEELTKHALNLVNGELIRQSTVDYNRYHECLLMLQKAGASKEELEKVDSVFLSRCYDYLNEELRDSFSLFWDSDLSFLIARENIYQDIRMGTTEYELKFQANIFTAHRSDFNKIIEESYVMFLKWVQQCYYYYQRRPKQCDYEYQYASFIEEITALCVTCCRNNCDFDRMSDYILFREKFKTKNEKKKAKKFIRLIEEKIAGYGEQPMRLLGCFAILAIVFSSIYFFSPGIEGLPENLVDRAIASLYFYITTCLTIGYGEIHPISSGAMIIVMFNEILGFAIGGAFISLYLRKIFRY